MENNLQENIDFYFDENGFFVFTAAYHLNRGYCCGNDCINCPYNKNKHNNDKEKTNECKTD